MAVALFLRPVRFAAAVHSITWIIPFFVIFSTILLKGDELMALVINSIRNDLLSGSNPAQSLALASVANLGGTDLAEALYTDVQRILTDNNIGRLRYLLLH